jgi:hypothetical protein
MDDVLWETLKEFLKQPWWLIVLAFGVALVALPCVDIGKGRLETHQPTTFLLVWVGCALLVVAVVGGALALWTAHKATEGVGAGLDLTRVTEKKGVLSANVSGCEIRVIEGRLEDLPPDSGTVIVLPCNEYFDDECAGDAKSALGAYVNRAFDGQVAPFIALVKDECKRKLGTPKSQQKTDDGHAESFGPGRCLLLLKPLGRSVPVALVSTTTQRAGQGLAARICYLFDGMRELVERLANARFTDAAMPILGGGHGRIDAPLALVGLLLAVAEAARYGQGGQRLRSVTIVVFKRDENTPAQVDRVVVRRALALIGSRD